MTNVKRLELDRTPRLSQPVSFFASINYRISAFILPRLTDFGLTYLKSKDKPRWQAAAPSAIKTYPVRPHLTVRVHTPSSLSQHEKHPLFVLIHGGGWLLGDASMDDEQGHFLATKGYVVISPNYSMAPQHKFPTAIHDVACIVKAALEDTSLSIDPEQLVLGGFSAGAVMTLAVAQLPELQNRIKALVAFQPLTDWTGDHRGPPLMTEWGAKDTLVNGIPRFGWGYIPEGHDLRDPLLSPLYATRKQIPQPLFLVTSSHDVVMSEAAMLARGLAGKDAGEPTESWADDDVRYECVMDMPHCFTHFWVRLPDDTWTQRQRELNGDIWEKVTEWLNEILTSSRSG